MLSDHGLRSVRDRVLLLKSLPSFAALDDDAAVMLAEHARARRFRAGETLLVEGEPVPRVYILIDGQVTSMRKGIRVATVQRSRGVGFISALAGDTNGVHVVADHDTLTLEIPAEALVNAFEENFSLARNSLRLSAAALVKKRGNLPAPADRPPPFDMGTWRDRPRTLVELLIEMRDGSRLYKKSNLDALIAVARKTTEIRADAGDVFWNIGDRSTFWIRPDYGRVRCTSADGRFVDVGKRFVLGIMDSLGQVDRSYAARAETQVIAYRLELEPFLTVLETHYELAREMISVVATALLETPES
jgi:CRP-like cAMP-binding protein